MVLYTGSATTSSFKPARNQNKWNADRRGRFMGEKNTYNCPPLKCPKYSPFKSEENAVHPIRSLGAKGSRTEKCLPIHRKAQKKLMSPALRRISEFACADLCFATLQPHLSGTESMTVFCISNIGNHRGGDFVPNSRQNLQSGQMQTTTSG